MSFKKARTKIDNVDAHILKLLNERARLASRVANIKVAKNLNIFSAEREALILKRLKKLNKGPLSAGDIDIIFREILSVCRAMKLLLDVAYLVPEGTFTHLAAIRKFGKRGNFISSDSIREVFRRVEREDIDYGVVPVENSIEGVVNYTLDMFLESNLKICSEIVINISHSLLRHSTGRKVLRIYSNPQVFSQCRGWLAREYPKAELIPTASTAKAAELVKKDPSGACMGSRMLATLYGLKEVKSKIEDSISNVTRFLVISKEDSSPGADDKTSILFSVKDRVGALHEVLDLFKKNKINLTKIESRPSKRRPWEYYFFIDFKGHRTNNNIKKTLLSLEKKCTFLKILGSYPEET